MISMLLQHLVKHSIPLWQRNLNRALAEYFTGSTDFMLGMADIPPGNQMVMVMPPRGAGDRDSCGVIRYCTTACLARGSYGRQELFAAHGIFAIVAGYG